MQTKPSRTDVGETPVSGPPRHGAAGLRRRLWRCGAAAYGPAVKPAMRAFGPAMSACGAASVAVVACVLLAAGGPPAIAPSDVRQAYRDVGFREIASFGEQHVNTRVKVSNVKFSRFNDLPNPDKTSWMCASLPAGLRPEAFPCEMPEDLFGNTWIGISGRDTQSTSFDRCFASKEVFAESLAHVPKQATLNLYGVVVEIKDKRRTKTHTSAGKEEETVTQQHKGYGLICEGLEILPPEKSGEKVVVAGAIAERPAAEAKKPAYTLEDIPMPPLGEELDTMARRDTKRAQWEDGLKGCQITVTAKVQDIQLLDALVMYSIQLQQVNVDRTLAENQIIELPVYDFETVVKGTSSLQPVSRQQAAPPHNPEPPAKEVKPVETGKKPFAINAVRAAFQFDPIPSDAPGCINVKRGDTVTVKGRIVCVGCKVDLRKAFEYRNGVPLPTGGFLTPEIQLRVTDMTFLKP